jgi:NAD(P)-dependent dehydrogenase (short-subunit alcohol dehydrogenase family)
VGHHVGANSAQKAASFRLEAFFVSLLLIYLTKLRLRGGPEEVAAGIMFLLSPASSYINGQYIAIDGGFTFAAG